MNLPNIFPGSRTTARNIFISYRVQDTAGETGRQVDALKERFDEKQIFVDIEKIEPGLYFSQVISRSLDACDVMLAIIGPNWLGAQPGGGTPRIQNPQTPYLNQYLTIRLALSPDGRYLNGTQTYQATGISTPFYLTKVE